MADVSRHHNSTGWLLAATPFIIVLVHYLAVLPHEFGHSFAAWILGIKSDPWNIEWGHGSIGDILLLLSVDEKVDYAAALAKGNATAVAVTALAGPATSAVLYLLTRFAVPYWRRRGRAVVA